MSKCAASSRARSTNCSSSRARFARKAISAGHTGVMSYQRARIGRQLKGGLVFARACCQKEVAQGLDLTFAGGSRLHLELVADGNPHVRSRSERSEAPIDLRPTTDLRLRNVPHRSKRSSTSMETKSTMRTAGSKSWNW